MKLWHLAMCALALVMAPAAWAQAAQDGPDPAQIAELVLANHILANEGVLDAYGHVSVRETRHPNRFLLSRAAPAGAVTAADIIEYDLDAKPVSDPNAGGYIERYIHAEIYKARPDVMAVIHSHAAEVIPFTVTGVPLKPMIHMAGFMPPKAPVFDIRKVAGMTDLLIRTPELGKSLAATLGSNPLVLLRGHGAVVVGPSLHVVVGRAYYMTVDARAELQAIALGGSACLDHCAAINYVTFLAPEEAEKAAAQDGFERAWTLWKSKVDKQDK